MALQIVAHTAGPDFLLPFTRAGGENQEAAIDPVKTHLEFWVLVGCGPSAA